MKMRTLRRKAGNSLRLKSAGAAVLLALAGCSAGQSAPKVPQEPLMVMSALPLFWGDGGPADIVQGKDQRAPVIAHLGQQAQIVPLDTLSADTLAGGKRLMLAQPRRLAPEELVALDEWVRAGGQVLLLVDAELAWPSSLAPGDPRRPPPVTLLDPLFTHWGLELLPLEERPGIWVTARSGSSTGMTQSAARWQARPVSKCRVVDQGITAECALGKGRVVLVADADLIDLESADAHGTDNRPLVDALVERLQQQDLAVI
jgi:hypothetical protein